MEEYDVAIVGAGIAGAGLAAELREGRRVLVLEAEKRPGVHATGRSAALYSTTYGNALIQILTRASGPFIKRPPNGFAPTPLFAPRPVLFIATHAQQAPLAHLADENPSSLTKVSGPAACEFVPAFRRERIAGGLLETAAGDLDVDALHQGYLRQARKARIEIACAEPLQKARAEKGRWVLETAGRTIRAKVLVNAAGAWADHVAMLSGVNTLGLSAKRRTAALIQAAPEAAGWPCVIDVEERFYFKPDAGQLLISPADETDVEAHDAHSDELALAEAIERIGEVAKIEVKRKPRSWAGLRTFAADRTPVVGFEADSPAPFFWLAGQGGYGIQTAPAMSELASALIAERRLPSWTSRSLLQALAPARLRESPHRIQRRS